MTRLIPSSWLTKNGIRDDMMTSVEYLQLLLKGDRLDRHFMMPLVKQFCTIQTGRKYGRYSQDYRVLTECQIEVLERFPIDIFNVLGYPYREAADCGLKVSFPDDAQPISQGPLIKGPEDLGKINWPVPHEGRLMSDRINAIRSFKQLRPDIVAMGAVEAPFAQACTFMGIQQVMTACLDAPGIVKQLIDWIEPREISFALAQIQAGAEIIFVGDSLASQVGPVVYERLIVASEARVVQAIQEAGASARLHICGDINNIMSLVANVGAEFIDVDFPVDIPHACNIVAKLHRESYVVGNFHPVEVLLHGSSQDVRDACLACEEQANGLDNFILAPGCEVPPATPAENYRSLIEFGWKFNSTRN